MDQNRITLIGFLGRDAEVRNTRNNSSYTVLSLATKASWKDHDGEWQSRTEWHRCIVWGKFGEFAATLTKGMHLQVEGELRSREYQPRLHQIGKPSLLQESSALGLIRLRSRHDLCSRCKFSGGDAFRLSTARRLVIWPHQHRRFPR